MQEPVTFQNHGQKMFGMLHIPESPHKPPFPAIVMLHGFTGNKIEPHQLFVKAARRFAKEGILALRFDFRCCGESEGLFEELTIEGKISDALEALRFVRSRNEAQSDRIGLLGYSLGGAIAASVAGESEAGVRCLVLWAAVADSKLVFEAKAIPEIVRDFGERTIHDYRGNALSQKFLDGLLAFKPLDSVRSYGGPVLIMHGDADNSVSPDNALLYEEVLSGRGPVELNMVRGAGHTTARFLARNL
ncbi:MAG: alpha/beta hydrolase [bacterium]